jgi:signal transduction histidine kinase
MDNRLHIVTASSQDRTARQPRLAVGSRPSGTTEVAQFRSLDGPRDPASRTANATLLGSSLDAGRIDRFVATLGHELRQPLSALLAAVETLQLEPDPAVLSQITASMRRQINQMVRVIDDVMDQRRWAHGTLTLHKARIDIRDVIRDAALDIQAVVAARDQQLVVELPGVPLWVDADAQRLHQVLSNLFQNAVKYTAPGGRITVAAARDAVRVTVRVGDTGRGIEPEALTRIFDMFSQALTDAGGLGIGLSVAREIVALHDGQLEACSDGAGRGSEFVVVLPAAAAPGDVASSTG